VALAAEEAGLDAALVRAVVEAESGYDPQAVSRRGARGLMQIIPSTWRELNPGSPCRGEHAPPAKEAGCIFDAAANLEAGTRYLRKLLEQFRGDVELAVAAYNAGSGAVEQYATAKRPGAVPPITETKRYTAQVLDRWAGGRLGLSYPQARALTWLVAMARWVLLGNLVLLGLAIVRFTGGFTTLRVPRRWR
jgi:soluble lytic murein transglycosylase-like protein